MIPIVAIAGLDEGRVIGRDNALPWRLPEDLKRFKKLTVGHTILMGRKTFESLPNALPKRHNVVVTRSADALAGIQGIEVVTDLAAYIAGVRDGAVPIQGSVLWIIGGEQIYRETLPHCTALELTRVSGRHEGDAFFPEFEKDFSLVSFEPFEGGVFERYERL